MARIDTKLAHIRGEHRISVAAHAIVLELTRVLHD